MNEFVRFVFRHGAPEQEALGEVAALVGEPIEIGVAFDSLGGRLEAQARADLDDGVDQLGPFAALLEIGDVALVDLDLVEAQFAQMMEAGIARAEIVERDLDAEILQRRQSAARRLRSLSKRGLGDLDLEASRGKARLGERWPEASPATAGRAAASPIC